MFKSYLIPYINDSYLYFPIDELSSDPKTRFNEIFKYRQKWLIEELEPYIEYKNILKKQRFKYTRNENVRYIIKIYKIFL